MRGGRWDFRFDWLFQRGQNSMVRKIKKLAVAVQTLLTKTAAVALAVLTAMSSGQLRAEPFDRLGIFLGRVIDRLDADGVLDRADFDCTPILPDLDECTDPVTRLSFLHLATPEGANVSLMVRKARDQDGKDLALSDRASGEQLMAAFKALPQTALAARGRCALLPDAADTEGHVLGIKPPLGGYPVYLIHGGLDDAALATLDRAGGDGELLSAILLVAVVTETCAG